ncbi:hypothetical protein HDF24_24160 [Mucilaginibacter sp. X4EP1]|uniref:hypothetical protein n=1 Tax=Mucilaginibacter sp. X4EP1 TaxID=2723092 RepID=UPI0021673265|nr:hypothetical protein [Mucilaginibacter sp. X4EP1]MCS3816189.1 hypothetical protein [Mucilaginibacter sp. X4EP1]
MPSKIILIFTLLTLSGFNSKAWVYNASWNIRRDLTQIKTTNRDTADDEFNNKKESTSILVRGKSVWQMLTYYQLYLKKKDEPRADTLMYDMLKKDSTVELKYKISLISYSYTSDTKTKLLFLSNTGRLEEYRTYFLKYNISALKSNKYIRAHYYNLVALDSVYYQIASDSMGRIQMAHHYNSLGWYSMLTQQFGSVEYYLNQSIKYNPGSRYPYSNLPLLFLLTNHYQKAKALYLKYKDLPFDKTMPTYKDEFFEDFKELKDAGMMNNDIEKIIRLLNEK